MFERKLNPPEQSFFLLGMRGTGKSFWAKRAFPNAHTFNLLDEKLYQELLVHPDLFVGQLRRLPPQTWVVVDEIQRLPNLLNEVHRAIEELKLRFVLLGSSARKLRRAGVNLLGGRALLRTLYPLLPAELGDRFSLNELLEFGSLPLIVNSQNRAEQLEAYVQLYLREEIQGEALVRNLQGFARFLPVAALFHGQVLNVSSLARDAGVHRATVEGYLSILEDTLIAYKLPAFEGKLRVKERRHPKWYWIDSGVQRAAKRHLSTPSPEERGALFEGFISMCLRAYHSLNLLEYDECYYWAPAEGETEVDFLLSKGDRFIAIEAKTTAAPATAHFAGLRSIAELKGIERRILVHLGDRSFNSKEGVEALCLNDFLSELDSGKISF